MTGSAGALGLAGLALAVLPSWSRSPSPLRRLRDLLPRPARRTRSGPRWRPDGRRLLAVLAGSAVAVLVGLPTGLVAGGVAGWAAWNGTGRLERAADRRGRRVLADQLPPVLDLLAVCLRAGLPAGQALGVVSSAVPGAVGAQLGRVAALYELGAGTAAWHEVRSDPVLGPVARAAIRSGESGSALAADFERLADEHRARSALHATVHTQRVALVALAPLGLCFLPAFVCLGVVPLVLGIAGQVFR